MLFADSGVVYSPSTFGGQPDNNGWMDGWMSYSLRRASVLIQTLLQVNLQTV